jgi:hypothetical protein
MSIDAETWRKLSERAEALGITRTELIRRSIDRVIDTGDADPDLVNLLQAELVAARRQLLAIGAVLATGNESTVAA